MQNAFPLDGGRTTIHVEALSSILLVISALLTLAVFFFGGKFVLADYHHRKALNAVAQNQGLDAYNSLVKAELLNPVSDFYRIDIAQINFALANAIASAKSGAAGTKNRIEPQRGKPQPKSDLTTEAQRHRDTEKFEYAEEKKLTQRRKDAKKN